MRGLHDRSSPHFIDTNNHNDFFAIGKLEPLQTNSFVYGFVRLFHGIQVVVFRGDNA